MSNTLYTIGHSTHPMDRFLHLISMHSISEVLDVRSIPYSRYSPQFNLETLKRILEQQGIPYIFEGTRLGARSRNPEHYINSKVQYARVASSQEFQEGLASIREEMSKARIAIMCAEKDPLRCHRAILITRHLRDNNIDIHHIREDGMIEKNEEMEKRLMRQLKFPEQDMFMTYQELLERAYDLQSERIAYEASRTDSNGD